MCVFAGPTSVSAVEVVIPFRFLCLSCRFGFEFMFHATPTAVAATETAAVSTTIAVCPHACACL